MPHLTRDTSFTLPAFAKINWTLRVLGRRAEDGLHEVETVMQTVSLCDRLTFAGEGEAGRLTLTSNAADLPLDENNLIIRAANLLRRQTNRPELAARIHLEKMIPAGGGLGGGSSDAAAALVGLTRLWQLDVSAAELTAIAAALGADVPFFLTGGTALATGTGRDIRPLADADSARLVIVTPPVHVATAAAYAALGAPVLTKGRAVDSLSVSRAAGFFDQLSAKQFVNDFEATIFAAEPEILRARERLLEAGARKALMSGSGASVFGLFDNEEDQRRAQGSIRAGESEWRVFDCSTLNRAEYERALGLPPSA